MEEKKNKRNGSKSPHMLNGRWRKTFCLAEVACFSTALCDSHAKHGPLSVPHKHIPPPRRPVASHMQSKYSCCWMLGINHHGVPNLPASLCLSKPSSYFGLFLPSTNQNFLPTGALETKTPPPATTLSASVLPSPRSKRGMYGEAIKVRSSRRDPAPDPVQL